MTGYNADRALPDEDDDEQEVPKQALPVWWNEHEEDCGE